MFFKVRLSLCALIFAVQLPAQTPSNSFVAGSPSDEAVIREIVKAEGADKPDPRIAADLDWENAFGVRYTDLKKMKEFYGEVVTPLQKNDTDATLEVKVKFLTPEIAVADEYWHIAGQLDYKTNKPGPDRWGRTTYIFKKEKGTWTELMERVADLRAPYYKHYDSLPVAAPVPATTLASYAGTFERSPGNKSLEITVSGDHLSVVSKRGNMVAIPTSPTEFLVFDPNDLAEYMRYTFTDNGSKVTVAWPEGDVVAELTRAK